VVRRGDWAHQKEGLLQGEDSHLGGKYYGKKAEKNMLDSKKRGSTRMPT